MNNVYENQFLGMTFRNPDGWKIRLSREINDKKKMDVRDMEDLILMTVFPEILAKENYQSNMTFMVENLQYNKEIKDGSQYLDFSVEGILEAGNYTILSDDYRKVLLGNIPFSEMEVMLKTKNENIYQNYLSTVRKGIAFSIILTYKTKLQSNVMMQSLDLLKFEAIQGTDDD
jgi:hypothetical protein